LQIKYFQNTISNLDLNPKVVDLKCFRNCLIQFLSKVLAFWNFIFLHEKSIHYRKRRIFNSAKFKQFPRLQKSFRSRYHWQHIKGVFRYRSQVWRFWPLKTVSLLISVLFVWRFEIDEAKNNYLDMLFGKNRCLTSIWVWKQLIYMCSKQRFTIMATYLELNVTIIWSAWADPNTEIQVTTNWFFD
jgi:hypothetical protein